LFFEVKKDSVSVLCDHKQVPIPRLVYSQRFYVNYVIVCDDLCDVRFPRSEVFLPELNHHFYDLSLLDRRDFFELVAQLPEVKNLNDSLIESIVVQRHRHGVQDVSGSIDFDIND